MTWLIEELVDLAVSIAAYIGQAVYVLIQCLFYPVKVLFAWVSNIVNMLYLSFVNLISAFWESFNLFYDFVKVYMTAFLPSVWVIVILGGLTIVFLLRLYHFLKDVSIAGFKI